MTKRIMILAVALIAILAIVLISIPPPNGTMTSTSSSSATSSESSTTTSTTTSSSTSTTVTTGGQACTNTEVTDINGNKVSNDACSLLYFIGLSTFIDGQQIYDSATGKSGQITKKVSFTHTPSKPVKSTNFNVGISALIGSTKISSNNTLIHLDGSPSNLQAISLTLTGLKLESYSYLFANGGMLKYVLNGNESFAFTDGTLLTKQFTGTAGNVSLTFQANAPTVTNTDECGGCPLNTSSSAYYIPNGSGTLTLQVVDYKGSAFPAANGGSISANYLCWAASKLTQPCSISPSSFSGTLNSNAQYSLAVSNVVLGSFNGFYLSGGTVVCCAPQYAPVGYIGSVNFVTPFQSQCSYDVITGELRSCTNYTSLPIQFVVAGQPTDKVGGTVYLYVPCEWSALPKTCFNY